MAPTLDTKRTSGLTPREGSLSNSHPVNRTATGLQYKNGTVALRTVSTSGQLDDLFACGRQMACAIACEAINFLILALVKFSLVWDKRLLFTAI